MGDLDLSGLDYSNFGGYSAFLTDQVAEQQNRIREGFAAISEYNAKKRRSSVSNRRSQHEAKRVT